MPLADKIPLKTFLETVEQRLSAASADQLRAILWAMAQQISPPERQYFLERLNVSGEAIAAAKQVLQEDLLGDIKDLRSQLEEAMEDAEEPHEEYEYGYGEGEEEEIYEDFIAPLSELFDKAEAAFDYGDLELARDAYYELFELTSLEDDYGRGKRIESLPGVDKNESRDRYLRAVYETAPLAERPEALFDALHNTQTWVSLPRPMLDDVIQISPKPLPDGDRFLQDWIAFLRDQTGNDADAWLREAVRLSQGTAGLEELARTEGKAHPRAYLDWFNALEQEGRYAEVLAAAQEAMQTLPGRLPIRAAITDHLCEAATRLEDSTALRAGRWEAFTAQPTLARLLNLWDAYPAGVERGEQMRQAADYAQDYFANVRQKEFGEISRSEDGLDTPAWINKPALVHAYFLAGDWRAAQRLTLDEPVLGWSGSENTQGIVLTSFLFVLSGKSLDALPYNLSLVWQERLQHSVGYWGSAPAGTDSLSYRIAHIYTELLHHLSLSNAEQTEVLSWCLDVANRRVDSIVGGQHRGSYDKAARLITACAEVLHLRGQKSEANALLNDARNRFPRHRAFQSEMNEAIRQMEYSLRQKS